MSDSLIVHSGPHRVVVIGSGFGGLFATRRLNGAPVEVTLIGRTTHHVFQPLLYQVATGILSQGDVAPATREILRRQRNARVVLGEVVGIDLEGRRVTARALDQETVIPYDSLIVATGSSQSYFGHDEFGAFAPGLKSVDDALEVRGRIFGALEMAEIEDDDARRAAWMTFVLIGAGPTGVEMAGQIAELSRRSLRRNFRSIDPSDARVLLFEGGERLLEGFGERLSRITARDLGRLGVTVHTRSMVVDMDEYSVDVRLPDGSRDHVDTRTKVWAAGMEASPLARTLAGAAGAEVDRAGRIKVLPNCTLPGHPEVYVVGDMMALDDLPGMAEVAMQTGHHAAKLIKQRLAGGRGDEPFHYHDLGSLATISRFRAVANIGFLK
ncbi:MAG: NAD(P)/FAD-dependent oxidoreductase, partial [Solirubrobacteraceae bacterium]